MTIVDDNGNEVLRKAAEVIGPNTYALRVVPASASVSGSTTLDSNSVGTVAVLIPAVAGDIILSFSARSATGNAAARRMEVSIDGGVNFWVLRAGESVGGDIAGSITQIWIRAQASTLDYEVVVTTE
jgi:hypothetical protein